MKYILLVFIVCITLSCKREVEANKLTAEDIINKSIEVSGGKKFNSSNITFNFRDMSYVAKRLDGKFSYARMFEKDSQHIADFLSNSGFRRMVGRNVVQLRDSLKATYAASVNSVHYFSVLPHGLNDKAVNKTLLEEEQIKDKIYYKIKVAFSEEGGGEDYEDVFVYWVDKESFKTNYLAYSYNEDDGIGMRFREAYNERYVNGLRFVDYNNFKAEDSSIKLYNLGKAFETKQLKLLSKIELKNVDVKLINN